jgi:DNA polymerase-1
MEGIDEYVLIDVSGLIFRSFFAMGALTGGGGGVATNAVYGVCRTLQELRSKHFPGRRMIAVFDHPDDSFRSALLPEYKAQRPPVPDDAICDGEGRC